MEWQSWCDHSSHWMLPQQGSGKLVFYRGVSWEPQQLGGELGRSHLFAAEGKFLQNLLVVGDCNIDQLPVCYGDPLPNEAGRSSLHVERRARLETWLDAHKLQLTLPNEVRGVPFSFADEYCVQGMPITRVPSLQNIFQDLGNCRVA